MRRLTPLAGLLLSASVAGCGLVPSAEDQATDVARGKARRMGNVLRGANSLSAPQDLAHRASELDDADVLKVSGTSPETGGVRLVVRVEGQGGESANGDEVTVRRCFELAIDRNAEFDTVPPQVPCPSNAPLTFAPWPKAPALPSEARLREALPSVPRGGRADETGIRAAVTRMRLDPAIDAAYLTEGDTVGLALTVRPLHAYGALDCVLVRVAPGETAVFTPSTIQRMPGEGGCSAGNAISPMPPPH
ncbi:translation initiation factor IF-2 [Actinomadura harenae]|uniref:Translation initiation factor IF-2 n=1 Tax=Actinomadura harenae TaxID=2483351 RepID=A0A3M2M0B5_9ACTN|nr:translation initiation factor IF-2 [Actinomadura harenae]RMI41815.1 translation initiation factor IF-2 [Actinomadura harenae]